MRSPNISPVLLSGDLPHSSTTIPDWTLFTGVSGAAHVLHHLLLSLARKRQQDEVVTPEIADELLCELLVRSLGSELSTRSLHRWRTELTSAGLVEYETISVIPTGSRGRTPARGRVYRLTLMPPTSLGKSGVSA